MVHQGIKGSLSSEFKQVIIMILGMGEFKNALLKGFHYISALIF